MKLVYGKERTLIGIKNSNLALVLQQKELIIL
jgi:hypothetical protein